MTLKDREANERTNWHLVRLLAGLERLKNDPRIVNAGHTAGLQGIRKEGGAFQEQKWATRLAQGCVNSHPVAREARREGTDKWCSIVPYVFRGTHRLIGLHANHLRFHYVDI